MNTIYTFICVVARTTERKIIISGDVGVRRDNARKLSEKEQPNYRFFSLRHPVDPERFILKEQGDRPIYEY